MKVNLPNYQKDKERKISIKIDKWDTWGLDNTLALIILPALLQLRENKNGVPTEFADTGGNDFDMQDSFDFYKESADYAFERGIERWNEVLEKMIWSFEQLATENYEEVYHHGDTSYSWVGESTVTAAGQTVYRMVDNNPTKNWYDQEGHKIHDERIQEGLELFGKYYRSLWE